MEFKQSARDFIHRYDLYYCDQDSSTVATFIAQFSTLASAQFLPSAQPLTSAQSLAFTRDSSAQPFFKAIILASSQFQTLTQLTPSYRNFQSFTQASVQFLTSAQPLTSAQSLAFSRVSFAQPFF